MRVLTVDVEGSKIPTFHPWQDGAFLSSVAAHSSHYGDYFWLFTHMDNVENNDRIKIAQIQKAIDDHDVIVAHNFKFDYNWLRSIGIHIPYDKIYCTSVAEYLIRMQQTHVSYKLDDCCARYYIARKTDKVAEYWDAGYNTDQVPLDILKEYNLHDCHITYELYKKTSELLESKGLKDIANVCFYSTGVLSAMESRGFKLDKEKANEIVEEYRTHYDELTAELKEIIGFDFNMNSGMQLSAALYGGYIKEKYRETVQKTLKSGKIKEYERNAERLRWIDGLGIEPLEGTELKREGYYSTETNVLKGLKATNERQLNALDILLDLSNTKKVIQTFTSSAKDSSALLHVVNSRGFVHPNFNQTTTITGRLSSSKPNGQNLPRKGTSPIKKVIVPSEEGNVIINVDLAQIEWRMAGELSRDPMIIYEVNHGVDAHSDNAINFFGAGKFSPEASEFKALRTDAKIFVFRMIYGGSAGGFFRDRKMPDYSLEEWKEIVRKFQEKYSRLVEWQKENYANMLRDGYIRNFTGRMVKVRKVLQYDGTYGPSHAAVCNYPVQSIAADMIYVVMQELDKRLKKLNLKAAPIVQVHDSLVFDAPAEEVDIIARESVKVFEELPQICQELFGREFALKTTGDVEVGLTYGDIVEYNIYNEKGDKHLYKFKNKNREGKEETLYKWALSKEDVLEKIESAYDFEILYTLPNGD